MSAAPDPYQPHLIRADALFAAGDAVQAGQIWQAILKRDPANAAARAGLYRVKKALEPPLGPDACEQLLQDGCTLFDLGQTQDALVKWEQILAADPGHSRAMAYADNARRELGMARLPPSPDTAPEAPGQFPGAAPETPADEAERLVMEGVQIFDMGAVEEAVAKWRRALELVPGHPDAPKYLELALREQAEAAARPARRAPAEAQLEDRVRSAERLLQDNRPAEAIQAFQRLLDQGTHDPRIMTGYQQARTLLAARDQPRRIVVSLALPAPEVATPVPAPPAVAPPRALTGHAPAPRSGFQLPAVLQRWRLPALLRGWRPPTWLRSPRNLWITGGSAGLALLGLSLYGMHRREVALREAVAAAKQSALKPVSRMLQIPTLVQPLEAVRREAEGALPDDPLLAYFRAQEWQRQDPDAAAAAQLAQKAKDQLLGPAPAATLADFEHVLQSGNLEGGRTIILALLRHDPDDLELRGQARKVLLALVPLYVEEEKMDKAKDALILGRAMFPQDPGWQARLKLLEAIQAMAKPDRAPWIQLLG